jgi:heme ABC exporter ATP-binding subunit CcmA
VGNADVTAAIAVDGVWKFYGDFAALRDISLNVQAGSCTALLGRNGAGKTTLLQIIAGLSRAAKGRVSIYGDDVGANTTRYRLGVLGHSIGIYDELSALENLRLFGRLYDLKEVDKAAMQWLERVGLARVANGLVREFSRGMRQRLAVARAFLHDPQVLLLDEPFTSLDDKAIVVLQTVLRDALSNGKTVMMSTHQLREALELATHVALINRGRMAYQGERTREMVDDPGWLYRNYGEA